MEDMHIHLKDGIYDNCIFKDYINKCIQIGLKKVVFLDHGNRISTKHKAVLCSKESIDKFYDTINSYCNKNLEIISGIEIDYSANLNFRKETEKILDYGKFSWIVGAIHSLKFDSLEGYLRAVIDMLNNYKINAIAHLKLDDTYKDYEQLIISILELCYIKNIYLEINTSDRSRWKDDQLYFMLNLMNKYKINYVFSSDAHRPEDIGHLIEETMEKVKKWQKKK